jgi:hypothetical protein
MSATRRAAPIVFECFIADGRSSHAWKWDIVYPASLKMLLPRYTGFAGESRDSAPASATQ